jgi:NAD-dependent deacetylase
MPKYLNKVEELLRQCDVFIAVGTSGVVYPAAGFVQVAKENGAKTYLFNLDKVDNADLFDYHFYGKASETFKNFSEELLIEQEALLKCRYE